jgi:hypothetical protein
VIEIGKDFCVPIVDGRRQVLEGPDHFGRNTFLPGGVTLLRFCAAFGSFPNGEETLFQIIGSLKLRKLSQPDVKNQLLVWL